MFLLEKGKSKETQFSDVRGERNYTRGDQKFVYWGCNFSMAKNIEMIFGDLRCNSRLGRTFHHVASMYYIFTNFSTWLPRKKVCCYTSYFVDCKNDKTPETDIRL